MTHFIRSLKGFQLILTLIGTMHCAHAQPPSVLFIGDSYTNGNDLPDMFQQVALSLDETVNVAMSAPDGFSLGLHGAGIGNAVSLLNAQHWDHVVLQERGQWGALFPIGGSTAAARAFVQVIENSDECTYPVLFMTWGWEYGDPQTCADLPSMCTFEGMQQNLRQGYLDLAYDTDALVAPVGVAWGRVRNEYPWIDLYQADGSQPSVAGTYLAACVFYSSLFRGSCLGAPYTASLPSSTAAILQQVASTTVLDSVDNWNLNVPNGTDATFTSNELENGVACYHSGSGAHEWVCSNGESFSTNDPTFSFNTSGAYLITHAYSDPCGNRDTVSVSFDFIAQVISDPWLSDPLTALPNPTTGAVVLSNIPESAFLLRVLDLSGRELLQERITSRPVTRLDLGALTTGTYLIQLRSTQGTHVIRVLVEQD